MGKSDEIQTIGDVIGDKGAKEILADMVQPEQEIDIFCALDSARQIWDIYEVRVEAENIYKRTGDLNAVDEFCKEYSDKILAQKLKEKANMSKKFAKRTFETFKTNSTMQKSALDKAFKYAQNIKENTRNGKNIVFIGKGSVGTGKTHLAYAIANYALDCGIPTEVMPMQDLTNALYEFDKNLKKRLRTIKLLVLDDMGKEYGTPWLCSEMYGVLNYRYENELSTVITTENELSDMQNNYVFEVQGKLVNRGRALLSRLTENFVLVAMQGEDYRGKMGA